MIAVRRRNIPRKELTEDQKEKKRLIARERHLLKSYGITLDQYDELLQKQDYRCFICQKPETEFSKRLAVDHNHVTGEIRGLLCNYCNHRVVGRHRDPDLIKRLYDYLCQGTGWYVPKGVKNARRKRRKPKPAADI